MKKIFKSLAALALIAFAASCSKEQAVEAIPSGEEALVSFTVSTPALQTKAIADGNTVDKVSCNVYDEAGTLITNDKISKTIAISGGKATFSVRLVTGQTYSFIFWAYNEAGAHYTLDAANKKVTVSYTDAASNDESRDAFYAYVAPLQVTGALNQTVTLYRPFAQVNFGVTKADITAAKNAGIEVEKSSVKLTGLATELNLVDGSVSGNADAEFSLAVLPAEDLTVGTTDYGYVAMNYALVGKDAKSLSNAELKLYDSADAVINTVSVPNIPLQGNYRTNILGNLFTSEANFNLVVDPAFKEPDYDVELWDGSVSVPSQDAEGNYLITKASELAWVAQQTNAGTTFEGKTVKLQNDIDLCNVAWTPIGTAANSFGGTFDGGNYKISNLYVHSADQNAYLGLFGRVLNGSVKNFTINGAEIVSEVTVGKGASCGPAVGNLYTSTADNIKVINATVKSTHYVGGVIGSGYCSITNCSVENAELVAAAALQSDGSYDDGDKVGGILGMWGESSSYVISNCSVKNVTVKGYRDLGGIVGMAQQNDTVKDCTIAGVTITVDLTHNYKGYTDKAEFNANNYIGRKNEVYGVTPTESDNTGEATIVFSQTVSTSEALAAAVLTENAVVELAAGTYTLPTAAADGITVKGASKDAIIEANSAVTYGGLSVTFENLTWKNSSGNYVGIQHSKSVTYKNCVIEGKPTMYAETAAFENCTFKQSSYEYCIWTYGSQNITFTGCTFDTMGKAVKIYNESSSLQQTATFSGCTFKATNIPEGNGKAAIEIDSELNTSGNYAVVVKNCTVDGFVTGEISGNTLWNVEGTNATVTVDGVKKF